MWFLAGDPVGAVKRQWYALTDTVRPLEGVSATSRPQDPSTPGSEPENVLDGSSDTAWSTVWEGAGAPDGCSPAPGSAVLELSWDGMAQVRRIKVRVGLQEDATERFQQFVPAVLGVGYGDGGCVRVELRDGVARWQDRPLELDEEVDTVTIAIVAAHPPAQEPSIRKVSVRDIQLLARPG